MKQRSQGGGSHETWCERCCDDVDCPWLSEAERSTRATLLAGLTFVYRRPLDEEEEQNAAAAAGSGGRSGGGGRRSGGSVGRPSMDNLRTLCAAADAETRFVIASAGGELVEMSEDKTEGGAAKRGARGEDPAVVCLSTHNPESTSWTENPTWSTLKRCQPAEVLEWVLSGDAAAAAARLSQATTGRGHGASAGAVGAGGGGGGVVAGEGGGGGDVEDDDDATTDGGDAAMAQDDPATGHVDQSHQQQQPPPSRQPIAKTLVRRGGSLAPPAAVSAAAVAMAGAAEDARRAILENTLAASAMDSVMGGGGGEGGVNGAGAGSARDAAGRHTGRVEGAGYGPVVYAEDNGAEEGKAVVMYEPGLVVRRALAANGNGNSDNRGGGSTSGSGGAGGGGGGGSGGGSDATDATEGVPNFKKFRKTVHGVGVCGGGDGGGSRGVGGRAAQRRRVMVKYADEAYDTLHQWEDAHVAATHAAERAAARVAEEMFAEERGHGMGGVCWCAYTKRPR